MKLAVWILLASNLILFALMKLGGAVSVPKEDPNVLPEYQAEKIRLAQPASAPTPAAVSRPSAPVQQACRSWGALSGNDLAKAEKLLATTWATGRWSKRYVERANGFWVYIPPQSGKTALGKRAGELRAAGFEDFFVVREDGPLLGAISLGLFNQEVAGEKLLVRLHAKGIKDARLEPYLTRNTYAVFDLISPTDAELASLKSKFPDAETRVAACPGKS